MHVISAWSIGIIEHILLQVMFCISGFMQAEHKFALNANLYADYMYMHTKDLDFINH